VDVAGPSVKYEGGASKLEVVFYMPKYRKGAMAMMKGEN